MTREQIMIKTKILALLVVAGFLGGCENLTTGHTGALTGAALGPGIGMVAGGSFGAVGGVVVVEERHGQTSLPMPPRADDRP